MARHVRIRVSGGMYHVFTRGDNRGVLFCHEEDARHFLELLKELRERYRMRIYAYSLMVNHWHALIGTPEGNISQGLKWLNGSYAIWFNRRHNRTGHVYGERFKAILIEDGGWLLEASVYVHMNCVATEEMGLGKKTRAAQRAGMAPPPTPAEVDARLKKLREFQLSSYRGYAGYEKMPDWLDSEVLLKRAGGADGAKSYRKLVEDRIRQGVEETIGAKVRWGVVLGGERFARKVRKHLDVSRETSGRRALSRRLDFEEVVRIVERLKKAEWEDFRDVRGDTGRDLVLWACRRYGGMTLKDLGDKCGGMDYSAVAVSVLRLVRKSKEDTSLRKVMKCIAVKCQK